MIRVPSQFEFLDHWLALKAEEEVVCCQGGHRIPSGIGSTGNMWEDHCGRRELMLKKKRKSSLWNYEGLTAVFKCKERVICGQGLRDGDVQTGCSNLAGGQSLVQVLLVHHTTPDNSS